jgi:hypothetical protein
MNGLFNRSKQSQRRVFLCVLRDLLFNMKIAASKPNTFNGIDLVK